MRTNRESSVSGGEAIFRAAQGVKDRLGFMAQVKSELQLLFDFLDDFEQETGIKLILVPIVDDLDRCPKGVVVRVLEAIILLLVEAPITCWLAIDSRVVATSIEDAYGTVFSKAGISGYEFLEKIVQLPFCLPNLPDDKKLGFLNKIVEARELEPGRVLARVHEHMLLSERMGSYFFTGAEGPANQQQMQQVS